MIHNITTVEGVCKYIGNIIGHNPICVETGSTYCIQPENLVHTTTNNLVDFVCKPNNGKLFSFDIDKEHQELASSICDSRFVEFVLGDSVVNLKNTKFLNTIDVLCLDSKEFDEEHALNEYLVCENFLTKERHFVLVDDIHNPNSVKWKKVVPFLKNLGYDYVEIKTPTGLFLSCKGFSLC